MEKELLAALTTKFEGVDAKILGRLAKKLAATVTTTEQVATAVEGVTFQQVLESYGDSRATDAQKTAVANYEKKYNIKDGQPVKGGEPDTINAEDNDDDTPKWAKLLVERIAKLEGDKVVNSRKQRLDEHLSKLPATLQKAYAHVNLKDLSDDDFDSLVNEVSESAKEAGAQGATFGRPFSPQGRHPADTKEPSKEQLSAVTDRLNV